MAMPVAAVNEDHLSATGENDVRSAWNISAVKPEPVAQSVRDTANGEFGAGVPAADLRHHSRTRTLINGVHIRPKTFVGRPYQAFQAAGTHLGTSGWG